MRDGAGGGLRVETVETILKIESFCTRTYFSSKNPVLHGIAKK
jgi:hypothetical protein